VPSHAACEEGSTIRIRSDESPVGADNAAKKVFPPNIGLR
jgi:hypothetical protein